MIDILLATYNGSRYIEEQIDSILRQSFSGWRLIVHDDGSTDNTVDIIKGYVSNHPEKIFLIEDGVKTGGAKNNFFHLMKFATSDYVMFCDQDDVWDEDKIECTYVAMRANEAGLPCLVFTDLRVVDDSLNVISTSMFKYQNLKIPNSLDQLLVSNAFTGCTLMINNSLVRLMTFPTVALMHDWWVAIELFKHKGKAIFVDRATIAYRQHATNSVGAKSSGIFSKLIKLLKFKKTLNELRLQYNQYKYVTNGGVVKFFLNKLYYVLGIS